MKKFKIISLVMCILFIFFMVGCGVKNGSSSQNATVFSRFTAEDFDGNKVDESLFKKNKVTVLNFWFNGCSACVNEMPALEKINKKLNEKGVEIVGVNVEANYSPESLKDAKKIISKQGVTYRNIMITKGTDAEKYTEKITAFPTTIFINNKGEIVGKPIVGSIEDEKSLKEFNNQIDEIITQDK